MKLTDPVIGGPPKVQVRYVAFDSFGVKSMCTQIQTPDVTITVDPGVSVQSASFPLPESERERLVAEYAEACRAACASSQAIVVSHFHLDHFIPRRDPSVYGGKVLFLKALDDLPPKQAARARRFLKSVDGLPGETVFVDARKFRFKRTVVSFSRPMWHGRQQAEPGTVLMTEVQRGKERVLVTSDVTGPVERETTDVICASRAQTVVLDGYPTSHLGQFATDLDLVRSITNVCRILAQRALKTLVLDHHLARDYRYPAYFRSVYDKARKLGKRFGTAAELLGRPSAVIQGYQDYGPTKWRRWAPLDSGRARKTLEQAVKEKQADHSWLNDFDRWVA